MRGRLPWRDYSSDSLIFIEVIDFINLSLNKIGKSIMQFLTRLYKF